MSEYTPKEWVKDNPITNVKLKRLKELIDSIPVGGEIDSELSTTSENAVQNKVITAALETISTDIGTLESGKQDSNKYYTLEPHQTLSNTYVLTSGTIEDIYNDYTANKNVYIVYGEAKALVTTAISAGGSYICMASVVVHDVGDYSSTLYIFFGIKSTGVDDQFTIYDINLTVDTTADATSDNLVTNKAITTYVNNSIFGAMGANY